MFAHVLVPLDGSSLAEEALKYIQQVVAESGKVTLLRIVDMPPMVEAEVGAEQLIDILSVQAQDYLNRVADELRATSVTVETEVQIGDAAEIIVQSARKHGVDAIVMSTHGRSGVRRVLFGSVTDKVLRARKYPVLVIPIQPESEQNEPKASVVEAR